MKNRMQSLKSIAPPRGSVAAGVAARASLWCICLLGSGPLAAQTIFDAPAAASADLPPVAPPPAAAAPPTVVAPAERMIPPALEEPADPPPPLVELEFGMPRQRVLDLLGPPELESVIGVLERARVTYDDDTQLLFEDGRLVGLKTPQPMKRSEDGRLSIQRDTTTVVFAEELVLPELDPLPVGLERLQVDEQFYFSGDNPAGDAFGVHFTPAQPPCLLADCPGCASCGGGAARLRPGLAATRDIRFSVDALFLARDEHDFSLAVGGGETSPLSHGLTPGVRSSLELFLAGYTFAELSYLGGHRWSARGSEGDILPGSMPRLSSEDLYEAELDDFQANLIHRLDSSAWDLLWGVRYSRLSDSFASTLTGLPTGGPLPLRGEARNRLLGLQVGAERYWPCGPVWLFTGLKAGVLHNETDQRGPRYAGAISPSLAAAPSDFALEGEEVTLLGDVDLSVHYPLTRFASMRVGYQGLLFSDVVQVIDQRGQAAEADSLDLHGIFGGLEFQR